MQLFFAENGYSRAETVREAGEYAVRGGIVDLFPPGFEEPVRIDLFGDEVEKIRNFDPMSQRTTGERERLSLQSMVEFTLGRTVDRPFPHRLSRIVRRRHQRSAL
jgi:transcription-repair coupling factor (superfamily II helicase)